MLRNFPSIIMLWHDLQLIMDLCTNEQKKNNLNHRINNRKNCKQQQLHNILRDWILKRAQNDDLDCKSFGSGLYNVHTILWINQIHQRIYSLLKISGEFFRLASTMCHLHLVIINVNIFIKISDSRKMISSCSSSFFNGNFLKYVIFCCCVFFFFRLRCVFIEFSMCWTDKNEMSRTRDKSFVIFYIWMK